VQLKLYETVARYLLGIIYLFGAVDGVLALGFGIYLTGESTDGSFHDVLQHTVYFWAFMKLIEGIGAISLLLNIKPALGTALVTPISAVLCLFYVFDLQWYYAFTVVAVLNLVLLKAYWPSYRQLLDNYPMRRALPEMTSEQHISKK
jgi:cell division protein FtsW (lipid II flippase)